MEDILEKVCFSAKRALGGQTPETLRAYSFKIDLGHKLIRLRAHFAQPPSEDDLEAIAIVETEIDADFLDRFEAETGIEVAAPGAPMRFLSGGAAFLRPGEAGTICGA